MGYTVLDGTTARCLRANADGSKTIYIEKQVGLFVWQAFGGQGTQDDPHPNRIEASGSAYELNDDALRAVHCAVWYQEPALVDDYGWHVGILDGEDLP
jgi:hypothetical protein